MEETHREKVTRVMKDWSDLEEKYQDMRLADPKSAQSFKQRMTARFQVRWRPVHARALLFLFVVFADGSRVKFMAILVV